MSTLKAHGITSYRHKARKLRLEDFERFDYVFVMDESNLEDVMAERQRALKMKAGSVGKGAVKTALDVNSPTVWGKAEDGLAHVMLFGAFGGKRGTEEIVEDPYYGGDEGFETAFEQVDRFSRNFLAWLAKGQANGNDQA